MERHQTRNARRAGAAVLGSVLLASAPGSAVVSAAPATPTSGLHAEATSVAPLPVGPASSAAEAVESRDDGGPLRASPTRARDRRAVLATAAALDVPATALYAYRFAARTLAKADPSCNVTWPLLAAIGRVESDHGRYAGAELGADGVSSPVIRGVALDGRGPVARVRDTDGGALDGDRRWDRAVGPMQFLPSTWVYAGVDADADGVRSPDDLDDAALSAAVYLCAGPTDLATPDGARSAVHRYNPSRAYVDAVLALADAYAAGDYTQVWPDAPAFTVLATPATGQVPGPVRARVAGGSGTPAGPSGGQPAEDPADDLVGAAEAVPGWTAEEDWSTPAEEPPAEQPPVEQPPVEQPPAEQPPVEQPPVEEPPAEEPPAEEPPAEQPPAEQPPVEEPPSPVEPEPAPPPCPADPVPGVLPDGEPELATLSGELRLCDATWLMGDVVLDVGDADWLASVALGDLDGDGVVETNLAELSGLLGATATVEVVAGSSPALLWRVGGVGYRRADLVP